LEETSDLSLVLAGLIGAGVGGLLLALITTSHERAEQMRSRKIEAADQLSTAVIAAFVPFQILLATRSSGAPADEATKGEYSPEAAKEMGDVTSTPSATKPVSIFSLAPIHTWAMRPTA
jgi:hypothetical protein